MQKKNRQTNTRNKTQTFYSMCETKRRKKLKKEIFSISVGGLLKVPKLRGQIFTGKEQIIRGPYQKNIPKISDKFAHMLENISICLVS